MKNILKNLFNGSLTTAIKNDILTPVKTTNEIIEEIHHAFYNEVNILLESAKVEKSIETTKQDLLDKCERLKKLGFTNTKEVHEAQGEINRINNTRLANEKNKTLVAAINYFSFKYPNYKFITEDSVRRICEKYGLVYGEINRYKGTVPDKNLKQIEDFKVLEDDECYAEETRVGTGFGGSSRQSVIYLDHNEYKKIVSQSEEMYQNRIMSLSYSGQPYKINMKLPLEIAAPQSDFKMEGLRVKDFQIVKEEIPDPIVLKPVIFEGTKHYLIVTAWGIEAGDELTVNSRHN